MGGWRWVGGWIGCFLLTFIAAIHVDLGKDRVSSTFGFGKGLNLGIAAGLLPSCRG